MIRRSGTRQGRIPVIAKLVWEELVKDGRLGARIDIGMILSRILEEEGFCASSGC